MTQDDRTPTLPLAHLARFGYPLPKMAGGSPDDPEPELLEAEGTPEVPDAPEPPALPFSLDDVPAQLSGEEARAWLLARQGQMQSGYTKALQESRTAAQQAKDAIDLHARLTGSDVQARREAMAELLAQDDLTIEWPEVEGDTPELDGDDDYEIELPAEVVDTLERHEQRFQSMDAAQREDAWRAHTMGGLEAFATREKLPSVDALPAPVRDQIIANAMLAPRLESGLLDMQAGIDAYDVQRAENARSVREGYIASKDAPHIDLAGGSGDPHVDLSVRENRLKAAERIAQRHT